MYDVDLDAFWRDDALAHEDNCFSKKSPQVAMGVLMSEECVFAELGEPGNPWDPYFPRERRLELNRRYNDKAQEIVGRRRLPESIPTRDETFPEWKQIGEVFGGSYDYDGNVVWLHGNDCNTPEKLEALLDQVDRMDIADFILPENWYSEKQRIFNTYGHRPALWRGIRGPVTLATSIYGTENLIYLYYDDPDLFERFSQTILKVMKQYILLSTQEAGLTMETAPHGFGFWDDDCALMTPEMYEVFGYPVLKEIFSMCSPDPGDRRYQHSDSDMGHLLPILAKLNLTGCNFGPNITVSEIRRHMPRTRIDGQLAPFTFMSNDPEKILAEVRRDCEMAKEGDLRGLNLSTAGSINNGSLLESMRVVMYGIQTFGRY